MKRTIAAAVILSIGMVLSMDSFAASAGTAGKKQSWTSQKGTYAVIKTNKGEIVCRLFPDKAPNTVANFVGLAEGTKEWTDPRNGTKQKKPYFDALIFHRVIPDFMIQGGDPLGVGYGGPGYKFNDEIVKDLVFDKPGKLAMANSGTNTNGSQFFITVAETGFLSGKYTIFGEVVAGQEVAVAISQVKRDQKDKPLEPQVMQKVTIKRIN